jgi:hypothetical protein
MSEMIFRLLIQLYPLPFREEYGEEALRLYRDRRRDETGVWASLRLWFDLFIDLVLSLPREYRHARAELMGASVRACLEGAPTFFVFDTASPGRRPLLLGGLWSLIALVTFPWLMNGFGNFRPPRGRSLSSAYERPSPEAERPTPESKLGVAQSPRGEPVVEPKSRHRLIAKAVALLEQHHIDAGEAQKAADAVLAHERQGDDDAATNATVFARLLTKQMQEATGDHELQLLFSPHVIAEHPPGPPLDLPLAYRDEMRRINCAFVRVEILPHNIGYLKLNAFPDPSVCQATAVAAMARLNNARTLIFDLRDNRGGFPSMVSLIAAYLFDHPEYIYCPLRNTTVESWTHSPVPGNKLADKPVYILTSSRTISAAEEFAYDLKMLKRATLVGETTAGGAHAANLYSIGNDLYLATVEVRAINPYSRYDWNDTGIEPDLKISAPDALKAALRSVDKRLHVE